MDVIAGRINGPASNPYFVTIAAVFAMNGW
jgi:hypothetical protein